MDNKKNQKMLKENMCFLFVDNLMKYTNTHTNIHTHTHTHIYIYT